MVVSADRTPYNSVIRSAERFPVLPVHRESSDYRRPRLRLAIHPVDCAPAARTVGLRGDPAVRYAAREDPGAAAGRASSCRAARRACPRPARRTATPAIYDAGVPVLGICYGMQLMTHALGGRGRAGAASRVRAGDDHIDPRGAPLLRVGPGATCASGRATATSSRPRRRASPSRRRAPTRPVAAMAAPDRGLYALLFHPEVAHTDYGLEILRNFAYDVCGCTGDWTMRSFVDEATERIREQVGDGRVVCGLSGGVDSTRRGGADPPRDRRSADVHLRRQRRDAAGRRGADQAALRAAAAAARLRRCRATVPRPPRRRHRSRRQKRKVDRRGLHRRVRGRGAEARRVRLPRRRARSTRT